MTLATRLTPCYSPHARALLCDVCGVSLVCVVCCAQDRGKTTTLTPEDACMFEWEPTMTRPKLLWKFSGMLASKPLGHLIVTKGPANINPVFLAPYSQYPSIEVGARPEFRQVSIKGKASMKRPASGTHDRRSSGGASAGGNSELPDAAPRKKQHVTRLHFFSNHYHGAQRFAGVGSGGEGATTTNKVSEKEVLAAWEALKKSWAPDGEADSSMEFGGADGREEFEARFAEWKAGGPHAHRIFGDESEEEEEQAYKERASVEDGDDDDGDDDDDEDGVFRDADEQRYASFRKQLKQQRLRSAKANAPASVLSFGWAQNQKLGSGASAAPSSRKSAHTSSSSTASRGVRAQQTASATRGGGRRVPAVARAVAPEPTAAVVAPSSGNVSALSPVGPAASFSADPSWGDVGAASGDAVYHPCHPLRRMLAYLAREDATRPFEGLAWQRWDWGSVHPCPDVPPSGLLTLGSVDAGSLANCAIAFDFHAHPTVEVDASAPWLCGWICRAIAPPIEATTRWDVGSPRQRESRIQSLANFECRFLQHARDHFHIVHVNLRLSIDRYGLVSGGWLLLEHHGRDVPRSLLGGANYVDDDLNSTDDDAYATVTITDLVADGFSLPDGTVLHDLADMQRRAAADGSLNLRGATVVAVHGPVVAAGSHGVDASDSGERYRWRRGVISNAGADEAGICANVLWQAANFMRAKTTEVVLRRDLYGSRPHAVRAEPGRWLFLSQRRSRDPPVSVSEVSASLHASLLDGFPAEGRGDCLPLSMLATGHFITARQCWTPDETAQSLVVRLREGAQSVMLGERYEGIAAVDLRASEGLPIDAEEAKAATDDWRTLGWYRPGEPRRFSTFILGCTLHMGSKPLMVFARTAPESLYFQAQVAVYASRDASGTLVVSKENSRTIPTYELLPVADCLQLLRNDPNGYLVVEYNNGGTALGHYTPWILTEEPRGQLSMLAMAAADSTPRFYGRHASPNQSESELKTPPPQTRSQNRPQTRPQHQQPQRFSHGVGADSAWCDRRK